MPKSNKDKNYRANTVKESKDSKKEFVIHTNGTNFDSKDVWLLDSGASNNTCCLKKMFVSMSSKKIK